MGVIECWYTKADKLPVERDKSKVNIIVKIKANYIHEGIEFEGLCAEGSACRAPLSDWLKRHMRNL